METTEEKEALKELQLIAKIKKENKSDNIKNMIILVEILVIIFLLFGDKL